MKELTEELRKEIAKRSPNWIKECVGEQLKISVPGEAEREASYLCQSCLRSSKSRKMPKFCVRNGLQVDEIPDSTLELTELENNLIARNIIFQKIHKLPKSRWSGTHDRLVNVPVESTDVLNTIQTLPRTPAEAGLIPIIPVNLKRKLEYKTNHLTQMIDVHKIYRYLDFLKASGHPSYKFYDDLNSYEERCRQADPSGAKIIFPDPEEDILDLKAYLKLKDEELHDKYVEVCESINKEIGTDESDKSENVVEEDEEKEYREKDPVRKFQFDYDKATCMTSRYPEADLDSGIFSFAPAEGKVPTNILQNEDWDINSFPSLHPTGKNKMFQDRDIKLTPQEYLTHRLLNVDSRFEKCTPYTFAAAGFIEEKQCERNIGISVNKGKKIVSDEGSISYKFEEAHSVLDNIKGTHRYWKKVKMEVLAKVDNFGPFEWFYTLSCGDTRYDENFSTILREMGYKIIWKIENDKCEVFVQQNAAEIPLKEFLEHMVDQSKHEMIRKNVLTGTRNFWQRVKAFRTEIMMGKNNPMRIVHWSDKMEFQGRGAGHIHGVAWVDLAEVSNLMEKEKDDPESVIFEKINGTLKEDVIFKKGDLEDAFKNLRHRKPLTKSQENAMVNFVDRTVTCTTNPEMAAKMMSSSEGECGDKVVDIVSDCMVHHHTKTCRKYDSTCRFRYPKYPMWETIITGNEVIEEEDAEKKKERRDRNEKVLEKVRRILDDEELVEEIMEKYDKEAESLDEYRVNRKHRIMDVLQLAKVTPEEYVRVLKESGRKGINVVLARDIDEQFMNNYNPEWLWAWDANIDLQPCFDFFAVITYITEYFTQDKSNTTKFLIEASKQIKNLPFKDQQRRIKNVFLTHRQMGLSEAYVKIFPDMKLKDSNITAMYVPLGKKEDINRYLVRADPELMYPGKELFGVDGKEGLYFEKPNWLDKYLRRDMTKWKELCFTQFVKMYEATNRGPKNNHKESNESNSEDDNLDNDEKELSNDADKKLAKMNYLVREDGTLSEKLPDFLDLNDPLPGEPQFLKRRRLPKAIRFFKPKRDLNPERYCLHELMMYKSFDAELYERWHDDENALKDYEKYKNVITDVKRVVMEWLEDVEEARYFVEEVMSEESKLDEVAQDMDPENLKENIECDVEGFEEDENYLHLNTDGLPKCDTTSPGNWFKKIDVLPKDVLDEKTRKLDKWQRKVLENALKYANELKRYENGSGSLPLADNVVVIGGAGSGKSTVIECLSQHLHRLFAKSGDDPNAPYVLITATTGAAATNIDGTTVHTCLGFDFGTKHSSLTDKKRELKQEQLKNAKCLLVDEFSMMSPDLLYRIDLRMREVKKVNKPFGGLLVLLFGDLAQLKPVRQRYINAQPSCSDYQISYGDGSNSLWRSFKVINLEENHRQGEDGEYADLLNRIRTGNPNENDIEVLRSRIRPKNHPDIQQCMFVSARVKPVAVYNTRALRLLEGERFVCQAIHIQAMSKTFKPRIDSDSGRIGDTNFVDVLEIKIGARVMLIFNIDVSDLLCNGATGIVIGVKQNEKKIPIGIIVKFDNPMVGSETRKRNPGLTQKYPGGTLIKKMEKEYSLAKSEGVVSTTAKLIQFPLVLAWAVTGHKIQGQSIKSPQKIAVDLKSVFEAAQAYVMLSRVQKLEQLFLVDELPVNKIYANLKAMNEIERLIKISVNNNPNEWEDKDIKRTRVCFLNCRSMKNKFEHIESDTSLRESDIMFLFETWLEKEQEKASYELESYTSCFLSDGRGRGIVCYFKSSFNISEQIITRDFCLIAAESEKHICIGIYRSSHGPIKDFVQNLEDIVRREVLKGKIIVIGGDLNICAISKPNNLLTQRMMDLGFTQEVQNPTHNEGGLLDHVYVNLHDPNHRVVSIIHQMPKYYTDHDGICMSMWSESE